MDYCLLLWLLQVTETYHIGIFLRQFLEVDWYVIRPHRAGLCQKVYTTKKALGPDSGQAALGAGFLLLGTRKPAEIRGWGWNCVAWTSLIRLPGSFREGMGIPHISTLMCYIFVANKPTLSVKFSVLKICQCKKNMRYKGGSVWGKGWLWNKLKRIWGWWSQLSNGNRIDHCPRKWQPVWKW